MPASESPRAEIEAAFAATEQETAEHVNEDAAMPEAVSDDLPSAPGDSPDALRDVSDPGPVETPESTAVSDAEPATDADAAEAAPATEPRQRRPREKRPTAPIDWPDEAKAEFSNLPEAVQHAIHGREVGVNQLLQDTVAARRVAEGFYQLVEPYRALMDAEGAADPFQAIGNLLRATAALRFGSQAQKARTAAWLVNSYGIDIETLDKALAGSLPQNTEEERVDQLVNQRLQPFQQFMQQQFMQQQHQQAQIFQEASQSVEEMAQQPDRYPYFHEVRARMADEMTIASNKNEPISLDEAYIRACAATPWVREKLSWGTQQQQQQRLNDKRRAASSIVGRAETGTRGDSSLRDRPIREIIEAQIGGSDRI